MSVTTSKYRVGMSGNPANNFDFETDGAGSLLIKRASTGATVLQIDETGAVVDPRVWVNMGALTLNHDYPNDTGAEIKVEISANTQTAHTGYMYGTVDGAMVAITYGANTNTGAVILRFDVPADSVYSITISALNATKWREYRRAA